MQGKQQIRDKARKHAENCGEPVFLSWIDGSKREYEDAMKAVELCAIPRTASCIMGAICEDKGLETMLNTLLDCCNE